MSPSIWTRCAASFRPRKIELVAWRVVESQYVLATRKLVDSDEEQVLLEELIDRVKPPLPVGREFRAGKGYWRDVQSAFARQVGVGGKFSIL